MAYEVVKELKCIKNERKDEKGYVLLTVGEIYESACSNSTINSNSFMVFDDEGDLYSFSKEYFEIIKTETIENTGWTIKCRDCCKEFSLEELIKNNNICSKCGQIFKINQNKLINKKGFDDYFK